jgi:hypothetical protein
MCSRSQSPDWERNNLPNPVWKISHTTLDLTLEVFYEIIFKKKEKRMLISKTNPEFFNIEKQCLNPLLSLSIVFI